MLSDEVYPLFERHRERPTTVGLSVVAPVFEEEQLAKTNDILGSKFEALHAKGVRGSGALRCNNGWWARRAPLAS